MRILQARRRLILPSRRSFITGAAAGLLAAPAILRAGTMPLLGAGKAPGGGSLGLQTDCTAFFSLDNTLADTTGNVTDLTNNNAVTFSTSPTPPAAVTNSAAFVGASSQYLSHANATGINTVGVSFSIQVWVRPTSSSAGIASKATGSFGNREFNIGYPFTSGSANKFNAQFNSDGFVLDTSPTEYATNAWYHLVLTRDNTSAAGKLYVNGTQAASAAGTAAPAGTSQLNIGADETPSNFFNGNICLFAVWRNRVLTSTEVSTLYNSGNGLSYAAMA